MAISSKLQWRMATQLRSVLVFVRLWNLLSQNQFAKIWICKRLFDVIAIRGKKKRDEKQNNEMWEIVSEMLIFVLCTQYLMMLDCYWRRFERLILQTQLQLKISFNINDIAVFLHRSQFTTLNFSCLFDSLCESVCDQSNKLLLFFCLPLLFLVT